MEGEDSYVLKEIADSQWHQAGRGKKFVQYRIIWEGYRSEDSWEPYEMLQGTADEALREFHLKYPRKPRDVRVKL